MKQKNRQRLVHAGSHLLWVIPACFAIYTLIFLTDGYAETPHQMWAQSFGMKLLCVILAMSCLHTYDRFILKDKRLVPDKQLGIYRGLQLLAVALILS